MYFRVTLNELRLSLMKNVFLFLVVIVACGALADELPKAAFGKYAGEMESYTITSNDVEMEIEKHDVTITENQVIYISGKIELKGSYQTFKQSKTEYLVKASLSNGKNIQYQIEFTWNKKNKTLLLTGMNGEPDVMLDLLEY